MDNREKKLLINLVSTFLILLSACLFIALLIILKFKESCPEVIVGMLGVCATLYAPVAAFFFYDSWKEQFYFMKREEAIEKYIEQVSQIQELIYNLRSNKKYVFYNLNNINQNDATIILEGLKNEFLKEIKNIEDVINNLKINLRIMDRYKFNNIDPRISELWHDYFDSTYKLKLAFEHYQFYSLQEKYSSSPFSPENKEMMLVRFSQLSIYGNKEKGGDGETTLVCSNNYYNELIIKFRQIVEEI